MINSITICAEFWTDRDVHFVINVKGRTSDNFLSGGTWIGHPLEHGVKWQLMYG